ncbi:MAG: transposase [Clostridia bacterium]|nr:transposase [Clostridia bacterium]
MKLRQKQKLEILLSVAQLVRATFYYHLKQMKKQDKYTQAKEEITSIYNRNKGRYGYRRIIDVLRQRKIHLNHKTVQRLMKEQGMICRGQNEEIPFLQRRNRKGCAKFAQPRFQHDRAKPEMGYCRFGVSLLGEKVYLSPISELHSSDLVSFVISDQPVLSMVMNLLDVAARQLPPGGKLPFSIRIRDGSISKSNIRRHLLTMVLSEREQKSQLSG